MYTYTPVQEDNKHTLRPAARNSLQYVLLD